MEQKIRQTVAAEKLNVILLGFVGDKEILARLMSSAEVFLAVGPIETFGLAALEALASGTPVICRSEAAISEIITSNSGAHRPRNAAIWAETAQQFTVMYCGRNVGHEPKNSHGRKLLTNYSLSIQRS
jgi:glycosyltransferase involved in cell wall biosynthesis